MLFELLQASGCAHNVEVWAHARRLGIVSTYPYRAHTAKDPVGDGPRGRRDGPEEKLLLSEFISGLVKG